MHDMTTRRPYLIRAFNEWILDNGMTPYVSVDAGYAGTEVPRDFVVEGEIVLNISPTSVRNLELGQEFILFDARFSGHAFQVVIPVKAVLSIFARENGEGMAFTYTKADDEADEHTQEISIPPSSRASKDEEEPAEVPPKPPSGRPSLKIVK